MLCINRWVTDETRYPEEAVTAMRDRFAIDHAFPNWAVNRWLTALLRLYGPLLQPPRRPASLTLIPRPSLSTRAPAA